MLKCAIYARVSTEEQSTSIVNQQEYFKDYIQRNNYIVFDIYTDDAVSGIESKKRLSFQRLVQDGKDKKYDVLLAKSYSRFGRNQRETLTALSELFVSGIRIIFVVDGLDSLRDKGQFGLFAWLAEQESRKISERIKLTWQYYNREGKIHTANAPHGYEYNRDIKNFVINEEEARVVRLIFDMYLKGDGVRKIADFLNKSGYKTRSGCLFSAFLIRNILTNEFYTGSLIQGKRRRIDVTVKKLQNIDKKDWIVHKNNHEALISGHDFLVVQEQFNKRSKYVLENRQSRHSNTHLFSNLVKCGICGAAFTYKKKKTENYIPRYSCIDYEQNGVNGCGHKRNSITESLLMAGIRQEFANISENNFNTIKNYYNQKNAQKKVFTQDRDLKGVNKQINEKTNLSLSLLAAFSKGIVGEHQYKLQNDSIEKDLAVLIEQKEKILTVTDKLSLNTKAEAFAFFKNLFDMNAEQWTNEMMKKLIKKIEVDMLNAEINIFFNYSVPKC